MIFRNRLKLGLLLLLWAGVFFPIVPELFEAWFDASDNSHALLVPFISLFLVWRKRQELARVRTTGSYWGGIFLTVALAVYLVSYVGGIAVSARLMIVFSLVGVIWCCLGGEAIRLLAFPLGFLLFMVPVPESVIGLVSFPLQMLATKISAGAIQFCGIPVYREGNMLYFLQTQLEVAEACSGIRSIMALTMLSVLFAYLGGKGWWRKTLLVLLAVPIAVLANILRVSGTGILAHFFGERVARGFLHEFSGLVVFAFGLTLMCLMYNLLSRIGRPSAKHLADISWS